MLFARIFRGGCRGREPAIIKKVKGVKIQKSCMFIHDMVAREMTYFILLL